MDGPFNLTTSWLAPAFSQLDFSNCSAVVPFFTDLALVATENNTDGASPTSEGFGSVLRFLEAAVPDDWPYRPDTSQLALWYLYVWSNTTYQSTPQWTTTWQELAVVAVESCNVELCDSLQIKGDPEVSGRGMMGAYYISAILATIYFLVLIADTFGSSRRRSSRVLDAFRESTNTFLDAALIFAAAMLISTVARYASFARGRNNVDDYSTYRLLGSIFMSTFSIFPCVVLQCVADGLQRRFLRQGLWVVIVALSIVLGVQANDVYTNRFFDEMNSPTITSLQSTAGLLREYIWFGVCDSRPLIIRTTYVAMAGSVLLILNFFWLVYYVLASMPSVCRKFASVLNNLEAWRSRSTELGARWEHARPFIRLLNGMACCTMMWLLLGFFTAWCNHVQSKAPSTVEDTEWTFGQVLSLATWVPVLIEWLAVIVAGPEEGLGERLSRDTK